MKKKGFLATASIVFCSASLVFTGYAQNVSSVFKGAPVWKDPQTGNSFKIRGRVYADYLFGDINLQKLDSSFSGFELRTARLGVEGKYGFFQYKAEFDFADGEVEAKDIYIKYSSKPFSILFGNQKTPNSLDEQTSSRYITFMERGLITDAFGLDRRIGLSGRLSGQNYTLSAGVYRGNVGASPEQAFESEDFVSAARVTYAPVNEKHRKVHLGAHIRYLNPQTGTSARWRSRPGAHNTGRVLDTRGNLTPALKRSFLYGVELAVVQDRFHAEAEYMVENAKTVFGNVSPRGYYIQAGYFLTGETRSYKANKGSFGRTKPKQPLSRNGKGAIELAARYDRLDLSDALKQNLPSSVSVYGGELTTYTLGINWYPESHLRLGINYIYGDVGGEMAKYGTGDMNIFQFRVQMDW